MSRGAILTAALLLGGFRQPGLAGPSERELAEHAEEEFRAGLRLREAADRARPHFTAAANSFEELWRRGAHNPALARNLGNAYLLADDLPHAILSYRRGLLLAPGDETLRQNLAGARELVVYPPGSGLGRQPPDRRPPWLPRLAPGWVFAAAAVFYALAWLALTRWLMVRRGPLLAGGVAALLAAAALAAAVVLALRYQGGEAAGPFVVIAEDGVLLRKGDGLAFPPRYESVVNRGVEARLLFERGDWVQIELAGGEVGWVPRAYVLIGGAAV